MHYTSRLLKNPFRYAAPGTASSSFSIQIRLNSYKFYLISIFFLFSTHLTEAQNPFTEPNPKAYFKPELKRFEKKRTNLFIKAYQTRFRLESQERVEQINPWLSQKNPSSHLYPLKIRFSLDENPDFDKQDSQHHIHGIKDGFHTLRILTQTEQIRTSFQIPEGNTLLILCFRQDLSKSLPTLIPVLATTEKSHLFLLEKLRLKSLELLENLHKILSKEISVKDFVSPDYRDETGKKEDFSDFLSIHLNSFSSPKILWLEFFWQSSETFSVKFMFFDKNKTRFLSRVELDSQNRVLGHKTTVFHP